MATRPSCRGPFEASLSHELSHGWHLQVSDLHVCVRLKIGRSAVRPRPWPPQTRRSQRGALRPSDPTDRPAAHRPSRNRINPVHLRLRVAARQGPVRTAQQPAGLVVPSCSRTYQCDTWHLLKAGSPQCPHIESAARGRGEQHRHTVHLHLFASLWMMLGVASPNLGRDLPVIQRFRRFTGSFLAAFIAGSLAGRRCGWKQPPRPDRLRRLPGSARGSSCATWRPTLSRLSAGVTESRSRGAVQRPELLDERAGPFRSTASSIGPTHGSRWRPAHLAHHEAWHVPEQGQSILSSLEGIVKCPQAATI